MERITVHPVPPKYTSPMRINTSRIVCYHPASANSLGKTRLECAASSTVMIIEVEETPEEIDKLIDSAK